MNERDMNLDIVALWEEDDTGYSIYQYYQRLECISDKLLCIRLVTEAFGEDAIVEILDIQI